MPPLSLGEQANLLERLRRICLALPDTTEKLSHGEATFLHKKRSFLNMDTYHHGEDRFAAWVAAPLGARTRWCAAIRNASLCRRMSATAAGSCPARPRSGLGRDSRVSSRTRTRSSGASAERNGPPLWAAHSRS